MTWRVADCPLHPASALVFGAGTLCLACGRAIIAGLAGPALTDAAPELVAEAKRAWQANQGVRDFTASAVLNPTQTGDEDGPEPESSAGAPSGAS